jgi:predicted kinase
MVPTTGDPYSPEMSQRLYREILPRLAGEVLSGGLSVIVDATFLRRWQRDLFEGVAETYGVPLVTIELCVPETLARERILTRRRDGTDPSDADLAVFENQRLVDEPLADHELARAIVVDGTNPDLTEIVGECSRRGIVVDSSVRNPGSDVP